MANPVSKKKRGVSKQKAFLAAYVRTASVTKAANAAKIDRGLPYRWLKEDAAYALDFAQAQTEAAQTLEDTAVLRATEGEEELVIFQGDLCYPTIYDAKIKEFRKSTKPLKVRKRDNTLLNTLLKAFNPGKFKDRVATEVSGTIQIVISSDDAAL